MIPADKTRKLLRDFGIITTPALCFDQIFEHFNIIYDEMDYGNTNYMGSLIRAEGKTIILVNTDIKNAGRINFTKAHELGHFSLNHKGEHFECSRADMLDSTRKPFELEANQFAKEFLLPEQMVRPISMSAPFDFDTIKAISNEFMVSKLVTVFRILDFHLGNYAVIGSKCGVITHLGMSKSLVGRINLLKLGSSIHNKSFAKECLISNFRMNGYSSIDPEIWITRNKLGSAISLKEFSRADKSSGSVLTLLKVDFL
ncbi:ImmA/IrrE family metallo-endopeptidase [Paenibacillus provencensis]|uniref:ImmA/IrrE family metallo-endopeptidase n=1 Tax=Paenibacillus provencensis TaxID=441151 RepID=A0ABW3PXG5_9BACL|nr:ImmA/IrrE family metallo-endopeptidase [Paenibacillus sp. MER 78]MCM3128105.1 ImmA/IrrE family metallo-endopeptidase [Paenibacillus sp. MER 78]